MIAVQLIGGLGNQMFQYAIGRKLSNKRNSLLVLDTSWFSNIENVNTKRVYELDCYPISAKLTTEDKLQFVGQGAAKSTFLLGRLAKRSSPPLTLYAEAGPGFHPEVLELPDNVYLRGYWQNEQYFSDIRQLLIKEFAPKRLSDYSQNLAKKIIGNKTVSMHIRRGDYANNPLTNKFHGLTPVEYYTKALGLIEKQTGRLQRYIFSDDIDWCKQNLPFASDAVFVDQNIGSRAYEDIYLMSLCGHNVIANSSFSWWGAWLNQNKAKIVVAPKEWFRDELANEEMDVVPSSWQKL